MAQAAGPGREDVFRGGRTNSVPPTLLRDVRMLTLDPGLLQAGAGVKGELEQRLKNVIDEVRASAGGAS